MKINNVELNNIIMNLKEFRKNYGKNVSMTVCKTAYSYVLNGYEPKNSLKVAASVYAQKFLNNPLRQHSFRVEKTLGCIRIYKLSTETEYAQTALRYGNWNYGDRDLCIASLGENYKQVLVRTIELPDDLVVNVYEHFGRFVSVVALEGCNRPSQVDIFNRIGHVLAINALGYYSRYLDALSSMRAQRKEVLHDFYDSYLKAQTIEVKFGKYYNGLGYFPSSRTGERIKDYVERKQKELNTDILVAKIEVFGEF